MTGTDLPSLFLSSDACVSSLSIGEAPATPASLLAALCARMSASASPEETYSSVRALLAAASRSCLWPLKRRKPKGLGAGLLGGLLREAGVVEVEGEEVEGGVPAAVAVGVDVVFAAAGDSVSPKASLLSSVFVF